MKFRDVWGAARIRGVDNLSPTIRHIHIDPGLAFRSWSPGAHLRLKVRIDGREEIRTYSLVDLGDDSASYHIAVKLMDEGLGGSRFMWSLTAGDDIEISQPHNHFELSRYATSCTMVAGGVGITPFVSMARALRNADIPVRLYYGVRNREEAALAPWLSSLLGDRFYLRVAEESGPLDLAAIITSIEADGELYICGPIGMLEGAIALWLAAGRPIGRLRYETFASSGHYPTRPFTIELPRFGKTIEVAAHETLLSALEREGIELMSDCRRGECGLCVADIVDCDSPIDHRDVFLTASQRAESKKVCTCVSRICGGRLILDTAFRGTSPT